MTDVLAVLEAEVRNATAVFIINLSVSDLMFCCFNLPLAASTFWHRAWIHGDVLCQLFPLLRYGLLAVSLFTVLAITINRYVMIGHPRMYPKLYKRQYLGLMVMCTWVCGFGALVPTLIGVWGRFGLDRCIGSCTILPDNQGHSPKEFLFIVAFVIPCLAIVICYARIFYIVRKTALKSRVTTRRGTGVTPTNATSSSSYATSKMNGNSPGYGDHSMAGRFLKKCNFSIAEDSAIGSSSTGPTVSTDRSSVVENGHTSPPHNNNRTATDVKIQISGNGLKLEGITEGVCIQNPNLLSPPSPSAQGNKKIMCEPSSSSGVETLNPDDYEHDDGISTRSATPSSLCSTTADPTASPRVKRSRSSKRKHKQRERIPSSVTINSAFSHVTSVFRRGSNLRASPRRRSTMTPSSATPGKMTPKDRKLLKMILVIFASFVICYLPITISKTFHNTIDYHGLNIAGYLLIYLSTCINPIIYVVMSSEYRQAYKNLLMCRGYGVDHQAHNHGGSDEKGRSMSQRA